MQFIWIINKNIQKSTIYFAIQLHSWRQKKLMYQSKKISL